MIKKLLAGLLCGVTALGCLTGCGQKEIELSAEDIINFTAPEIGEEVVVLTIQNYGEVWIKLFPEECPEGVENFVTHVKEGYYDELMFHRVVEDFVIQGGDPTGSGSGGESIWGAGFEQEISSSLRHFNGALAYATASDKLNKSQFYIVTGDEIDSSGFELLETTYGKAYSEDVKNLYYEYGGQPYLDSDYEVFGQVFSGLEICQKIDDVSVNSSDKPYDAVYIEKAEVRTYNGETVNWKGVKEAPEEVEVQNLTAPAAGEEIAVLHFKDYGDVKIKLFPELCPKGVENFKTLIQQGYYDGVTCHRIIEEFVVQGGDPTGTGSGGESIWGAGFAQELNDSLIHLTGAVAYATATDKLNNSQFYIVSGTTADEELFARLEERYGLAFPEGVRTLYGQYGGQPSLDGNYEVFGQVFEGLDLITDQIQKVETDEASDKPLKDVIIESAEIVSYAAE